MHMNASPNLAFRIINSLEKKKNLQIELVTVINFLELFHHALIVKGSENGGV